ncbi:MAG TPA: hypothetical protein VFI24_08105 [Pyrinomonadaceae bacterium]|nr:hypothetical protein [Pyrinomonadaceae bacterium]
MKLKIYPILMLSILLTPTLVYSQGPKKPRTPEDYTPRTLQQLSELQPDYVAREPAHKDAAVIVHGELLPSRMRVIYSGEKRLLLQEKKTVIDGWANKFAGMPEFYTVPYDTEMLFTENGESYWLAVRKEFVPQFEQQFKKGDTLELFLIKMGSRRINDKLEPVILVEKFLK